MTAYLGEGGRMIGWWEMHIRMTDSVPVDIFVERLVGEEKVSGLTATKERSVGNIHLQKAEQTNKQA